MTTDLSYNAKRMRMYRKNMSEEQKEHRRAKQAAYRLANKENLYAYNREYRKRKKLEKRSIQSVMSQ
jgi:hypothetical protein